MQLVKPRKILDISERTIVMGILNVTPDSFSDGGEYVRVLDAVNRAKEMALEGARIIDIGGESTKPHNAEKVSLEEELQRVIPVITAVRKEIPDVLISIDTYKSEVAQEAIKEGADIVNDVSGLQMDVKMAQIVAQRGVGVVINHMRGTPQTHQKGEIVYKDIILEIKEFFKEKINLLIKMGVNKNKIILDPGFGFGKTPEHNLIILNRLSEFKDLGLPILIGVSRKSTLGLILKEEFNREFSPSERLEASLAAEAVAVLNGANIVRVHDVLQTKKFLAVLDRIRASK